MTEETTCGAKGDRAERKEVLALAQARKIDAILVTELTRMDEQRYNASSLPVPSDRKLPGMDRLNGEAEHRRAAESRGVRGEHGAERG
jgi:hypothetical protein